MQIDEFEKVEGHDSSIGLAFDPKHGGTHYQLIVFNNADGVITRLDRLVDDEWELVDEEPPFSCRCSCGTGCEGLHDQAAHSSRLHRRSRTRCWSSQPGDRQRRRYRRHRKGACRGGTGAEARGIRGAGETATAARALICAARWTAPAKTIGRPLRHGQSTGGPCGPVSLKLRQGFAGITTKKPSGRSFAAPFLVCYAVAYQPGLYSQSRNSSEAVRS